MTHYQTKSAIRGVSKRFSMYIDTKAQEKENKQLIQ